MPPPRKEAEQAVDDSENKQPVPIAQAEVIPQKEKQKAEVVEGMPKASPRSPNQEQQGGQQSEVKHENPKPATADSSSTKPKSAKADSSFTKPKSAKRKHDDTSTSSSTSSTY
jgi:hypothetical protein